MCGCVCRVSPLSPVIRVYGTRTKACFAAPDFEKAAADDNQTRGRCRILGSLYFLRSATDDDVSAEISCKRGEVRGMSGENLELITRRKAACDSDQPRGC